jgi:RNA polymerase sigma-70 factor (ECF subfamily)
VGHPYQARAADQRALDLTSNPAEQALLEQRINWTDLHGTRERGP